MHLLVATNIAITTPGDLDNWLTAELPDTPMSCDPEFAVKKTYYDVVTST